MTGADVTASDDRTASTALGGDLALEITTGDVAVAGVLGHAGIAEYGYALAAPEINIRGNGTTIADNTSAPSTSDNTDFGDTRLGAGAVSRAFTIQNTSGSVLTLGSGAVSITGQSANMAAFSVITQPSATIAALRKLGVRYSI